MTELFKWEIKLEWFHLECIERKQFFIPTQVIKEKTDHI